MWEKIGNYSARQVNRMTWWNVTALASTTGGFDDGRHT